MFVDVCRPSGILFGFFECVSDLKEIVEYTAFLFELSLQFLCNHFCYSIKIWAIIKEVYRSSAQVGDEKTMVPNPKLRVNEWVLLKEILFVFSSFFILSMKWGMEVGRSNSGPKGIGDLTVLWYAILII